MMMTASCWSENRGRDQSAVVGGECAHQFIIADPGRLFIQDLHPEDLVAIQTNNRNSFFMIKIY
jgi:hypothetical protein